MFCPPPHPATGSGRGTWAPRPQFAQPRHRGNQINSNDTNSKSKLLNRLVEFYFHLNISVIRRVQVSSWASTDTPTTTSTSAIRERRTSRIPQTEIRRKTEFGRKGPENRILQLWVLSLQPSLGWDLRPAVTLRALVAMPASHVWLVFRQTELSGSGQVIFCSSKPISIQKKLSA